MKSVSTIPPNYGMRYHKVVKMCLADRVQVNEENVKLPRPCTSARGLWGKTRTKKECIN